MPLVWSHDSHMTCSLGPGHIEGIPTDGVVDLHKQRDIGEVVKELHDATPLRVQVVNHLHEREGPEGVKERGGEGWGREEGRMVSMKPTPYCDRRDAFKNKSLFNLTASLYFYLLLLL